MNKRITATIMVFMIILSVFYVNVPEIVYADNTVHPTGVTLSADNFPVLQGKARRLGATVLPENATNKRVIWSSSDTSIATVDAKGTVTGVKVGSCFVTVKTVDGGYTDKCLVRIKPEAIAVTGVKLEQNSLTIKQGANEHLKATVLPTDATNKNVTWSSTNSNIASVDANGVVTGRNAGRCIVTVKTADVGYTASCDIFVINDKTDNPSQNSTENNNGTGPNNSNNNNGTNTNNASYNGTDTDYNSNNGTSTNNASYNGTDTDYNSNNGSSTNNISDNGTDTNYNSNNGTSTSNDNYNGTDTDYNSNNGTSTSNDSYNRTDTNYNSDNGTNPNNTSYNGTDTDYNSNNGSSTNNASYNRTDTDYNGDNGTDINDNTGYDNGTITNDNTSKHNESDNYEDYYIYDDETVPNKDTGNHDGLDTYKDTALNNNTSSSYDDSQEASYSNNTGNDDDASSYYDYGENYGTGENYEDGNSYAEKNSSGTEEFLEAGDYIETTKAVYIIVSNNKKNEVAFSEFKKANTKIASIPKNITYDGIKYKVTAIEENAFCNNKKLEKLTIGSNIKSIGKKAFYNCPNLETIVINTRYLTMKSVGVQAFRKISKKVTVKVSSDILASYKKILRRKGISVKAKFKSI